MLLFKAEQNLPDGSLGHRVYCKATHTNLYLNAGSHHQPSCKQAVLSTLVHRARPPCDQESLHAELVFLQGVFRQNGYNDRQIHRVLNRRRTSVSPRISRTQSPSYPMSGLYLTELTECCPDTTSNQWAYLPKNIRFPPAGQR
jgi:hypothetical protein